MGMQLPELVLKEKKERENHRKPTVLQEEPIHGLS